MTGEGHAAPIDWAVAGAPIDGETESGDLHTVVPFEGGVLIGAVDGLGHGPKAAAAARMAVLILGAHAAESPVQLMDRCHDGLRGTRGAVITLASFQARAATMTWMGVGNVEGILLRRGTTTTVTTMTESAPLRGGVVGFRLPAPREMTISLLPGDTLVLATDGIAAGFSEGLDAWTSPAHLAGVILAGHRKRSDDATVVVARYLERSS